MIGSLVTSIFLAGCGLLIVIVGVNQIFIGNPAGFPITAVGIMLLVIIGALNLRR